MKKIILISAITLSGLFYNTANAQIRVHLGIHLGLPRVYIPARVVVEQPAPVQYAEAANYYGNEDYYYLPDVDAYYSVPEQCYYYNDSGNWVSAAYLPGAYRDYDWRSVRHFEVRAPRPFMHDDFYRTRFNGVAFNSQWNYRNDRGNANNYRVAPNQYRNDDRRFAEGARGGFHQESPRASQENFHGRGGFDRGDGRHGRS
jgi:hypothetical protein